MSPKTTNQLWGVTSLIVNPVPVWNAFNTLASTGNWTPADNNAVWEMLLLIGITVEKKMNPSSYVKYDPKTGAVKNGHQVDELMEAIECALKFYKADPQKRVIDYFLSGVTTPSLQKRFYAHFRNKLTQCWIDVLRRKKNNAMVKVLQQLNDAFDDTEVGHAMKMEVAKAAGIEVAAMKMVANDNDWVFFIEVGLASEETGIYLDQLFGDRMDAVFSDSIEIQFEEQILMVNISRSYKPETNQNEIYEAAKEKWVLSPDKLKDIHYVVAEAQGMVQEVFEVADWYPVEFEGKTRFGFNGKVAPDAVRGKYINQSVRHLKKPGDSSVVHYFNLP